MSTPTGRTAILVDPHPMWLDAVERVVTRTGVEVVAKATGHDHALELIETLSPDVLVAELGEVGDGGAAFLREALRKRPSLKTIVLSTCRDLAQVDAAFTAGAQAYVFKNAQPDDVAVAVRQAFDQSVFFANSTAREAHPSALLEAAPARPLQGGENATGLTQWELEILQLVAEGYSNRQLARTLWVSEERVKFQLSSIYRKLGVSNRTEAGRWVQMHDLLPAPAPGQRLAEA